MSRRRASSSSPCLVCSSPAEHAHFGVRACRACAAFFRRSVAKALAYKCTRNGACPIFKGPRAICRACRLEKCHAINMNPHLVESASSSGISPLTGECPLLDRLQSVYEEIKELRTSLYPSIEETPKMMSYGELLDMCRREVQVKASFVTRALIDNQDVPRNQVFLLYQQYFLLFQILEDGFLTLVNGRDNVLAHPNGRFTDFSSLDTFLLENDGTPVKLPEGLWKIIEPLQPLLLRCLVLPMRRLEVDQVEMLALAGITFWLSGREGISDEVEDLAKKNRERILAELPAYFARRNLKQNASLRLMQLLMLIPALQDACRRVQATIDFGDVFGLIRADAETVGLMSRGAC